GSIVFDFEAQPGWFEAPADPDRGARAVRRNGIFHAVLDQRLQRKPRDWQGPRILINLNVISETVTKTDTFDIEVVLHDRQLVFECHERRGRRIERGAQ